MANKFVVKHILYTKMLSIKILYKDALSFLSVIAFFVSLFQTQTVKITANCAFDAFHYGYMDLLLYLCVIVCILCVIVCELDCV